MKAIRIPVPESPELDSEWYARRSGRTRAQIARHIQCEQRYLADTRETDGNRMNVVDRCPCGKHRGVVFFNDEVKISDVLCPQHVYLVKLRGWIRAGEKPKIEYGNWMRQFA